jgi:hypothetical protein
LSLASMNSLVLYFMGLRSQRQEGDDPRLQTPNPTYPRK